MLQIKNDFMKIAILYATSHGTSRKVAELLSKRLQPETTDLFDLKHLVGFNSELYDTIVIGGSIHAGKIQSVVRKFCTINENILLQKRFGLYLCGMNEAGFQKQLNDAYSDTLKNKAIFKQNVGGEFLIDKMNFLERFIIKKVSKVTESVSKLDESKIDEMAAMILNDR